MASLLPFPFVPQIPLMYPLALDETHSLLELSHISIHGYVFI